MPDYHFKLLLEHLTTAVMVLDSKLCLRYLNPAAEALIGVSHDQVVGTPISGHFYESEQALDTLQEAVNHHLTFTKRQAPWELPSGTRLTVDYSVTPIADDELMLEIQHLDRLLRISREEATSSAQATTRNLVRGLAHEIKNPLGGIRGAAQLLARELPEHDEELGEYTSIIIEEADRLRNLVDRMLGPHKPPEKTEINIHSVTERVYSILKAESDNQLNIKRDYDPSIPPLFADKERLIQAVLNIARNAWEAMSESGRSGSQITIRTRVRRKFTISGKHYPLVCCLEVIDNGPGIPPELINEIFYPMISGRANGTGLGLSISQQIISQHDGLIQCESRPGHTKFSLYLPRDEEHAKI